MDTSALASAGGTAMSKEIPKDDPRQRTDQGAHAQTDMRADSNENDLEGRRDMGGKHGGQTGMPKPEARSAAQQGIMKDERGQEQPADKARALHVSRKDGGGDPPGDPAQQ
jgi:hypothetical protein